MSISIDDFYGIATYQPDEYPNSWRQIAALKVETKICQRIWDDEDEFIADPDANERQFGDSTVISNWEERSGAEESGGQDEAGPDVDNTGARTNGKDDEESDSESSSRSSSSSGSGESGSDESSDESSDERQGRQAKCKLPSKGDGSETSGTQRRSPEKELYQVW